MSDLRAPLKTLADAPVDELTVQRMWRAVGKRRAQGMGGKTSLRRRGALALAACIAFACFVRFAGHRDAGSLRQVDGAELGSLEGGVLDSESSMHRNAVVPPRSVALDDGSSLLLFANARVKTLENTSSSLVTLLETGRVTFDVQPGGPRRWTIECGLATVEVVGTRFTVERSPHHGHVEVERGIVLVRGELVKNRIQRLTAGEALDIDDLSTGASTTPRAASSPSITPAVPSVSAAPSIVAAPPSSAASNASSTAADEAHVQWRELARKGAFKEAYGAIAHDDGVAQEAKRASVDDLLLLADVARLSGHSSEAVAPLTRVLDEHGGDPRAPIAAFTLGRVELDALGQAAAAAQTFARAISMGLPQGLREDAYARIVEARARSGDRAGARSAAADYEARYPSGRRLVEVRGWALAE
jgi:transmembrane sensor